MRWKTPSASRSLADCRPNRLSLETPQAETASRKLMTSAFSTRLNEINACKPHQRPLDSPRRRRTS